MRTRPSLPLLLALAVWAPPLLARPADARADETPASTAAAPPSAVAQATDSAAVVDAIEAYHRALQEGDTAAVRRLLADDVHVAESGGLETREEYLSHHLPGDMAFASAVQRERGPLHVTVQGDVAWAISTSRTTGTFRDRAIDAQGAELMVLSRDDGGWRIRAIHWSSRTAR